MKLSFRHIALLIGITIVIASFLFFGRRQDVYNILLLAGLITAAIFYLVILFGSETWKGKLIWTIVVITGIAVQQLIEPALIDGSYLIYLNQHKKTLAELNGILNNTTGDITIINDTVIHRDDELSNAVKYKLLEGRKKLDVYVIIKTSQSIYYGLWGFLDVGHGVSYFNKGQTDRRYRHLTGSWFR